MAKIVNDLGMLVDDVTGAFRGVIGGDGKEYSIPVFSQDPQSAPGFTNLNGQILQYSPARSVNIGAIGNSITYQNDYGDPKVLNALGYMTWAIILSKGRINFDNGLNFGVAGDTTVNVMARLDAAIAALKARAAQVCALEIGTNDVNSAVAYEVTTGNIRTIAFRLLAAGITPILIPILPRSFGQTTAKSQQTQRINTFIRQLARTVPGIILSDPTLHWIDQTNANGYPIGASTATPLAYTYDGLHPSVRGAFFIGLEIANSLASRLDSVGMQSWSQTDTYDATLNPTGTVLNNPFLVGTAGTVGTGATGVVADSYTIQRAAGTTGAVVASKSTIATDISNSYPSQVCVCTAPGGSANEAFRFFQQKTIVNAIGELLYGECEIAVSGITPGSFRSLTLSVGDGTVSAVFNMAGTGYMPDVPWTGVFRTPPIAATVANFASAILAWSIDGTVASAGVTITVSRLDVRKA